MELAYKYDLAELIVNKNFILSFQISLQNTFVEKLETIEQIEKNAQWEWRVARRIQGASWEEIESHERGRWAIEGGETRNAKENERKEFEEAKWYSEEQKEEWCEQETRGGGNHAKWRPEGNQEIEDCALKLLMEPRILK